MISLKELNGEFVRRLAVVPVVASCTVGGAALLDSNSAAGDVATVIASVGLLAPLLTAWVLWELHRDDVYPSPVAAGVVGLVVGATAHPILIKTFEAGLTLPSAPKLVLVSSASYAIVAAVVCWGLGGRPTWERLERLGRRLASATAPAPASPPGLAGPGVAGTGSPGFSPPTTTPVPRGPSPAEYWRASRDKFGPPVAGPGAPGGDSESQTEEETTRLLVGEALDAVRREYVVSGEVELHDTIFELIRPRDDTGTARPYQEVSQATGLSTAELRNECVRWKRRFRRHLKTLMDRHENRDHPDDPDPGGAAGGVPARLVPGPTLTPGAAKKLPTEGSGADDPEDA